MVVLGGSCRDVYNEKLFMLDIEPAPKFPPPDTLYHGILIDRLRETLNSNCFSDIKLRVENQVVYGHRLLLCLLSEKFRAMLGNGMLESTAEEIEIADIRYDVFMILLKFMYTGEVELDAGMEGQHVSTEFLVECLQAAD